MQERWRLVGASAALVIAAATAATVAWRPQGYAREATVQAVSPTPSVVTEVPGSVEPVEVAVSRQSGRAPAPKPKTAEPYQCSGSTKSGRQCKRMIHSGKFCYQHKTQDGAAMIPLPPGD